MLELWQLTALAETVAGVAYGLIAGTIGANLARGQQWRQNMLGAGTFLFFAAAALSRLVYAAHVAPFPWETAAVVDATRIRMEDPLHASWSLAAAAVAVWFFGRRHALRPLHNHWIWDDIHRRQETARQLQNDVVGHIDVARACLSEGEEAGARLELEQALHAARGIIGDTLQTRRRRQPGSLRIVGGRGGL